MQISFGEQIVRETDYFPFNKTTLNFNSFSLDNTACKIIVTIRFNLVTIFEYNWCFLQESILNRNKFFFFFNLRIKRLKLKKFKKSKRILT